MTVYKKQEGVAEANGVTTTYFHGQGLISEEREGNYRYYHYNNLGSTMKLTDGDGQIVESYTYGVYGELLSGDSTLTHFLYNGRCGVSMDANGLYYMRQRYYNPEIKRFINQDILTGSISNSQSLNRYSYVQGNPVSYTDPFGLSPVNGLFSNSNNIHGVMTLAGFTPGPGGAIADLLDNLTLTTKQKAKLSNISVEPSEANVKFSTLNVNRQNIVDGDGAWNRRCDSEFKILNEIAMGLGDNVNVNGSIKLYSDLDCCPSCKGVIEQFQTKYLNIDIEVLYKTVGGD